MILEAIITTRNADGTINVAPMGPHCPDPQLEQFELRPFQTSTTFANLSRAREGVLHITDDVLLFARSAVDALSEPKDLLPASTVDCKYLADSCRIVEFRTRHIDISGQRAVIQCEQVAGRRLRDFFGFNRAKHAVIEASILATRIDFLPEKVVQDRLVDLGNIVSKTGGNRELKAFEFLLGYVNSSCDTAAARHGSA